MQEILFTGDSLIEYFDWAARFPEHRVHNMGWSGETVEGLLGRLELIIRQCPNPGFIFIMSGTNNIALEETDFVSPYRHIIDKLKKAFPAARICIHSLPPILIPWFDSKLVPQANRKLRTLADETGTDFIDVYKLFQKAGVNQCLVEDGVHISDRGYTIWSAAIRSVGMTVANASGNTEQRSGTGPWPA